MADNSITMRAKAFIWAGGPERIAPGAEFTVKDEKEAARLEALEVAEKVQPPAPEPKALDRLKVDDLKALANGKGIEGADGMTKAQLPEALKAAGVE